jgi:hypothetical protein
VEQLDQQLDQLDVTDHPGPDHSPPGRGYPGETHTEVTDVAKSKEKRVTVGESELRVFTEQLRAVLVEIRLTRAQLDELRRDLHDATDTRVPGLPEIPSSLPEVPQ